jgi:hypothetical protein
MATAQWAVRTNLEAIDRSYIREEDWTEAHKRAEQANRSGNANKFQNITIPVVMPQVESAVVYQSSVFLTGSPIFGIAAPPAYIDQAVAMESVILENSIRYGWVRNLILFFRDGAKYNLSFVETDWKRKVVPTFDTDVTKSTAQADVKEVIYQGNCVRRLDPYNTFIDLRVPPAELHTRGEFAGYTDLITRVELKEYITSLEDRIVMNVKAAFEAPTYGNPAGNSGGIMSYFLPEINPHALIANQDRGFVGLNWMSWAGLGGTERKIQYQDYYEKTTLYARIVPSDHDMAVPSRNTPQIWKFVIINHTVIIYAQRLTNAHGYLPILCGQPNEDGLQLQTKSLAMNVQPYQYLSSALMNSVVHGRRRAISDRVLYDPSRISEAHINSANPSAKIPVRPSAYGKNIAEAVYAFPFRDDQAGLAMTEIQQLQQMANMVSGQNPIRQGQFVKGNKTVREFSDVMSNANGRDQLVAMMYESQVFTPMKEIIKANILQYQGPAAVYNPEEQSVVQIDPVKLRKAIMEFKVSDGLIPTDKLISGDSLAVVLQTLQAAPALQAGYNVVPMFSYLMKSQGAKIKDFEKSPEQQAYEQAVGAWQQAVSSIAESLKGLTPQEQKELLGSLPPQPKPEDYKYTPAGVQPNA